MINNNIVYPTKRETERKEGVCLQQHQNNKQNDVFRNIEKPSVAQQEAMTSNKKSNFTEALQRHSRAARSSNKHTSRSIVDSFLKGPIGTELYTNPHPWWEVVGAARRGIHYP